MKKNLKKYSYFLFLIILISVFWQCARRGSPTGGPKDEKPPVLLFADPKSGVTQFNRNKIRLIFDEFVVIKDLRKQLIISPPMENFPIISPMSASKKLDISILDTLKPNTTYVFNFGSSIQDYNEGNPYSDFKYVFSTGNFVDSLKIKGKIRDAYKPKPDNFVTIMLYEYNENYKDSLVYKDKPTYVTNTLDSLETFELNYLRKGKYILVALKDKNSNYRFDQKEDKIAFWNEPISVEDNDTLPSYELTLFKEILNYKPARPTQVSENRISFGFEGSTDSVQIKPISPVKGDFKYIISKEPKKDTLNFWFSPKQSDSLLFAVQKSQKIDTFKVRLKNMKPDSLLISNSFSGELPMGKNFAWRSNIPILKVDTTKIKVFDKDSLQLPFKTNLDKEKLEYSLLFDKKYNTSYRIEALPEAITDFFGNTNDTLRVNLKTKKLEDYSILKLTIKEELQFPVILQLTNEKGDKTESELYFETAQKEYVFENINPGKYKIRIIEDKNKNKIWDTGNFLERIQPERILYYPNLVELRANWEVEEVWDE
ncbi:Ig-like domain-containing protein [Capnocytophaga cynodegmi]|uniref:Ig-like domain-containing protein n=1 Tax=Capnocytophaga cynodegmi TaxID=28189 RepID=UPI0005A9931A|nr:Ig-like domain-containing protein [Capnocytophaga cynodegmi]